MAAATKQSLQYVTALYNVSFPERYMGTWERFKNLTTIIPGIHVFCSKDDAHLLPENVIPHFYEFKDLKTYKIISQCTGLPRIRSESKDHFDFMTLMNAKTEFIYMLKELQCSAEQASHYVWIDAGIDKIFKDPKLTLTNFFNAMNKLIFKTNTILIPGCITESKTPYDVQLTKVNWRFCGGFFIVPCSLVEYFYYSVLFACEEIRVDSGRAIWEVNVWNYVEQHTKLPIQWEYGNHDEHMFDGIFKYATTILFEPPASPTS